MPLATVLERIDAGFAGSLGRLFEFLRIPSISADPAFKADVERAADWLVAELTSLGFVAGKRSTPLHPMVVARYDKAGPDRPHVLFYGHYDVQPVDPLSLWKSSPFDPQLEDGPDGRQRIVARGASDDKGQLMTFVEACRALIAETGTLPVNVTIFSEGEEESGSPSMVDFLTENREELAADFAFICDTGMWDASTPAITTMLRGLVGEEIRLTAASHDLHSGAFGGVATNPIHVLADILAGLHGDDGRVTLPGFYDGVSDIAAELRANWEALGFDEAAFLASAGLTEAAGEAGRTVLEKLWALPTAEVNGISGGYAGKGFKTVLPAEAEAKVSFRLVGDQDPVKIRTAFRDYVRGRLPADVSVSFSEHGGSPAVHVAIDGEAMRRARAALAAEWGRPTALIGSGGSIPVAGYFKSILDMDTLLIGFALDDDRIHSPNEKYERTSFHKGIRSWARILDAL